MGLLSSLMNGSLQAATPAPDADFWYQPIGPMTSAGIRIGPEGAQKISAWYRGKFILQSSLAMLPLPVYRRLPDDGGREPAPSHPLYYPIHNKPNAWQDSYQWRFEAMGHLIDYGWHFSELVEGRRGFADQLQPIHPSLVTVSQVERGPNKGRWLFDVRDEKTAQTRRLTQDDVFFLRGADGKGILEYARDSLALGVTLENYASKIFSRGAMNGGIIEVPGAVDEEAMKRTAQSFKTAMGEWHLPRILSKGATFKPAMMEPEKAQMILSRKFTINDIARWLGLPPHMIGDLDRATFTNIEHQGQEFVTYSLGPWLSLWEFAINDQLILQTNTFYAEFNRDALVRGDLTARWAAYVSGTNAGIIAINEVRTKENLKKVPGGDVPREPANITGKGNAGTPPRRSSDSAERAEAIVLRASERVLNLEKASLQKAVDRYGDFSEAFQQWATKFYDDHAKLVQQAMLIDEKLACGYCALQLEDVMERGFAAKESWDPGYLAALALDTPKPTPQPHIEVHSPVTISEGAVHANVTTPDILVQAPITVEPSPVNIAKGAIALTTGGLKVEKGAIQHDSHITVPKSGPSKVTKKIKRDGKNQIAEVIEEHS